MARHLTLQEREMVSQMHHAGSKQVEIARRLNRHPSTISRELRRNRSRNGYWAVEVATLNLQSQFGPGRASWSTACRSPTCRGP